MSSFLASFLPAFLPSLLPNFLPAFLPSFLSACLPVCLPSFLPCFLPSFLPAFLPSFLPLSPRLPSFPPAFLPSFLPSFLPYSLLLFYCKGKVFLIVKKLFLIGKKVFMIGIPQKWAWALLEACCGNPIRLHLFDFQPIAKKLACRVSIWRSLQRPCHQSPSETSTDKVEQPSRVCIDYRERLSRLTQQRERSASAPVVTKFLHLLTSISCKLYYDFLFFLFFSFSLLLL